MVLRMLLSLLLGFSTYGLHRGQPIADQQEAEDLEHKYWPGNAVPRRDVPPPDNGCTVTGKVYQPLSPDPTIPFTHRVGWDWCQSSCEHSYVPMGIGKLEKCKHFAFYPDGKCYLQGSNVSLQMDLACNEDNPCEHGFQVISGPPSCQNSSLWVYPIVAGEEEEQEDYYGAAELVVDDAPPQAEEATTSASPPYPTFVAEGETCNGSLPPQFARLCNPGLTCVVNVNMLGAPGICTNMATTQAPAEPARIPEGQACGTEPSAEQGKQCEEGLLCLSLHGSAKICTKATSTEASTTAATVPVLPIALVSTSPAAVITTPVAIAHTVTEAPQTEEYVTLAAKGAASALQAATTPETVAVDTPPAEATITGYYYVPHNLEGTIKDLAPSWRACMQICANNPDCFHFGYWPDGGCHQQGQDAKLRRAVCDLAKPDCPGSRVISGPRDLDDKTLWPRIDEADVVVASILDEATRIFTATVRFGKDNFFHFGMFVLTAMCVFLCMAGVYYGCGQGCFGDIDSDSDKASEDGNSYDDLEECPTEDAMMKPLTGKM